MGGWVEAEYLGTELSAIPAPTLTVTEATQLMEVVGACIKFGVKSDEIYFPEARLSQQDLKMLLAWGQADGWRLIWHDDRGVTVTRRRDVDETFLWKPEGS